MILLSLFIHATFYIEKQECFLSKIEKVETSNATSIVFSHNKVLFQSEDNSTSWGHCVLWEK